MYFVGPLNDHLMPLLYFIGKVGKPCLDPGGWENLWARPISLEWDTLFEKIKTVINTEFHYVTIKLGVMDFVIYIFHKILSAYDL